jgi:DsbC/DsbD-like thiol-disulfide interchange protein
MLPTEGNREIMRIQIIRRRMQCLLMFALAMTAVPSGAEVPHPIKWSLTANAATLPLRKGSQVQATLSAHITPGWHLYAMDQPPGGPTATKISLPPGQAFTLNGSIESQTVPIIANDPNFNLETRSYEGDTSFRIPVEVTSPVSAAKAKLTVEVFFQSCSDRVCLPPTAVRVSTLAKQVR